MPTNVLFDPGKFEHLTHLSYEDIGECFFTKGRSYIQLICYEPYVINKRNLHHCKRYSVHYTSTYPMLSCHARSLHNLAKSGVEGRLFACLSQHEGDVLNLNIAEHCYSWCCYMADGYDMKTLVTWTMCVDVLIENIEKHKFSVKFK